jgi:hypothetical protein
MPMEAHPVEVPLEAHSVEQLASAGPAGEAHDGRPTFSIFSKS